jgi:hypothetical protein
MNSTSKSKRPEFVGENWYQPEQGYAYEFPPFIDLLDKEHLDAGDEWLRFLYVFEKAKTGDFSYVDFLPDLIRRTDDPGLWGAALELLAISEHPEALRALVGFMSHPAADVRLDAYAASTMSYDLAVVEPLLRARPDHLSTERGMIENALSHLLESEAGVICEPVGLSLADYERLVTSTAATIKARVGAGAAVFMGSLLDIKIILARVRTIVSSPDLRDYSGTLMDYLHRFEALTGWPCHGLFDEDGNPLPLSIRATIESFEHGRRVLDFEPGRRYFFGRLIGEHP